MKTSLIHITSFLILAFGALSSCDPKANEYDIDRFFEKWEQDTIMANIITNIYKVPKGVNPANKHDLQYRKLYVNQIPHFKFVHYHIDASDSTHFFYLIRPARNEKGFKRGVLGKYKLGTDFQLLDLEEIANTPMLPEEKIKENGEFLWKDLMYYGHVDRYFLNKEFIEFPDDRARYDKKSRQWTYEKSMDLSGS